MPQVVVSRGEHDELGRMEMKLPVSKPGIEPVLRNEFSLQFPLIDLNSGPSL
jgi:hypothetical protein